ncbi:MAG: peroxiredoxin [Legionellales bacterium]|nr:peroxiredoxin [Legionellales bacterium]
MPATLNRAIKSCQVDTTDSSLSNLTDCLDQWLVIYFYPKDNTSGCSLQAEDFTKALPQFDQLGAKVVGVSRDSLKSHEKFIEKLSIGYPLITDPDEKLCLYFDVMKEKSMYGRKYMGIERSTFIIDPKGVLRHVWRKVKVKGHIDDVLHQLEELQSS